jgi:DNA-binding transcriptional MerR regulator
MQMKFDSVNYTIGQVSDLTNIPQSALRYWETVFHMLEPQKTPGGNRKYSEDDIKIILKIKELLYTKGFTIKGANNELKKEGVLESKNLIKSESIEKKIDEELDPMLAQLSEIEDAEADPDTLKLIIRELKSIIRILED